MACRKEKFSEKGLDLEFEVVDECMRSTSIEIK
jgi:hypothetical protein